MTPKVLVVEDDVALSRSLESLFQGQGWEVVCAGSAEEATRQMGAAGPISLVVSDVRLPGRTGLEFLDEMRASQPQLPVVMMTAHGAAGTAIEATKRGAYDYVVKPFDPDELLDIVEAALEQGRLWAEPVGLGESGGSGLALVGRSRSMQALCKEIGRVAGTTLPVLILGETGTGKELVARALYQHGSRSRGPFLCVNCAAVPEALLESELFGHERGAFTGAERRRIGRFEQAHGGTLFLDEIGDLAASTQAKLLRVLQDGRFHRVGGEGVVTSDVRVLSATHHDLEGGILEGGGFREDLFFRLSGVILRVPALRERREDIGLLVDHFLRRYGAGLGMEGCGIRGDAVAWLAEQPWPGNVRQLENVVRHAMLLARPLAVGLEHVKRALSPPLSSAGVGPVLSAWVEARLAEAQASGTPGLRHQLVAALDAELCRQAVRLGGGSQSRAARLLGVSRLKVREALRPPAGSA